MLGKIATLALVAAVVLSGSPGRVTASDPVAATMAAFMAPRDAVAVPVAAPVAVLDCPNGQCRIPGFGARPAAPSYSYAVPAAQPVAVAQSVPVAQYATQYTQVSGGTVGFRPVRNLFARIAERRAARQGGCGCR